MPLAATDQRAQPERDDRLRGGLDRVHPALAPGDALERPARDDLRCGVQQGLGHAEQAMVAVVGPLVGVEFLEVRHG
jgi:hypothetical protein